MLSSYIFDVVNPIIKAFWLLIAWKFARIKMSCIFQLAIIINVLFLRNLFGNHFLLGKYI